MSKIICVSGDSFTQEYLQNAEHRWSVKIGASDNIAMGGASNDRIFNSTIEYLNHKTPDILIVGWTVLGRGMLPRSNGSQVIITSHRAFDEHSGEDLEDFKKFYYAQVHNDFVCFRKVLNHMIFLQEYCRSKKIKLLYFRSVLEVELSDPSLEQVAGCAFMNTADADIKMQGIKHNVAELKKLLSALDRDIWIKEFWYSMRQHMQNSFAAQFLPGYDRSLPVAAVDDWAQLVKKYL